MARTTHPATGRKADQPGHQQKRASRRTRRRRRLLPWRWILLGVVAVIAVVAGVPGLRNGASLALSRAILYATSPFGPNLSGLPPLPATSTVVAANGNVIGEVNGGERRRPVTMSDLPPVVPHAVLAAEDANFYKEAAVNPLGVVRALVADVGGSGQGTQGGSTITQQLAKVNYVGSKRSILRKLNELLYADELARHYTKDQLLQRYLNQVYFGDGAYGIAAAARTFFDETPQQLTAAQAATLAGKIRAPETLDPFTNPSATLQRRNEVLRAMATHGWLTPDAATAAEASAVGARHGSTSPTFDPAFIDYVRNEASTLPALGDNPADRLRAFATGGYTFYTTLNTTSYTAADNAAKDLLGSQGDPDEAVVGVQPGDGAIRVYYPGLAYQPGSFDPIRQGRRQAGSSFKPFTYIAALQDGIDPRSYLPDFTPMTFTYKNPDGTLAKPWTVNNYAGETTSAGQLTIDQGLAQSINTIFAQVAMKVGASNIVRVAQDAGIPAGEIQGEAGNPAITLGVASVSPLDMATAYATIAAKGVYAAPYSITKIVDRTGHVIYRHTPQTRAALDPLQVAVLTNAMQGVVQYGTGTAAAIGRPLAGKTGTTEGSVDAWFIGFTPQLSTAVWVGQLAGEDPATDGMNDVHGVLGVTGGTYPADIFSRVVSAALDGQPVEDLTTASPAAMYLRQFSSVPYPPSVVSGPGVNGPVTPATTYPSSGGTGTTTTLPGAGAPTTVPGGSTTTSIVGGTGASPGGFLPTAPPPPGRASRPPRGGGGHTRGGG